MSGEHGSWGGGRPNDCDPVASAAAAVPCCPRCAALRMARGYLEAVVGAVLGGEHSLHFVRPKHLWQLLACAAGRRQAAVAMAPNELRLPRAGCPCSHGLWRPGAKQLPTDRQTDRQRACVRHRSQAQHSAAQHSVAALTQVVFLDQMAHQAAAATIGRGQGSGDDSW